MDGIIFCMDYENLVVLIKSRMVELGINQSELAQKSKLSASQISRILKLESTPSQDAIVSMARALRLPAEDLFRAAGLLPPDPDFDKVPTLGQWIKLFVDADDETRERLLESAQSQAEIEAKLKRRRTGQ